MKMQMLYIRDIIADCIPFSPMFVHHIGGAIRDFGDQCQNKETVLGKHPEDYELYHHGEWDDVTGQYTALERPKQIAVGASYRKL